MSTIKKNDQRGLVSFLITLIMMLVISLIVIGFTQVTNRNRRQALDRQLSTQAFYAAESGVNEAVKKIRGRAAGTDVASQDTCDGTYSTGFLNIDETVGYTCILVDPTVPEITTSANQKSSSIVAINPSDKDGTPSEPTVMTFTWSAAIGQSTNPGSCNSFDVFVGTSSYSCGYAILRLDLMPVNGQANALAMANDTVTLYMQPVNAGSLAATLSGFGNPKAIIVAASCSGASGTCTATINLSPGARFQHYYARLSTLYRDTDKVTIDASIGPVSSRWFKDYQATVDVTGKAQDVLRRVQVRVPLQDLGDTKSPQAGLQSNASVCKRFTVRPGSVVPSGDPFTCS